MSRTTIIIYQMFIKPAKKKLSENLLVVEYQNACVAKIVYLISVPHSNSAKCYKNSKAAQSTALECT